MSVKYHFSYQPDWRTAPVAFWVHRPVDGSGAFDPPVPSAIPHKGFAFLHVEVDAAELVFSAPAQLEHFIDVLSKKPLPTGTSSLLHSLNRRSLLESRCDSCRAV